MATVTRKRSRATAVNQAVVGQASILLQDLPEKQKEALSLRAAVKQMQDHLKAALAKGYSYEDLATMLSEKGIKISALTLKSYVPSGKRQATKLKAKRAAKSTRNAAVEQSSAASGPEPSPIAPLAETAEPALAAASKEKTESVGGKSTSTKTKTSK